MFCILQLCMFRIKLYKIDHSRKLYLSTVTIYLELLNQWFNWLRLWEIETLFNTLVRVDKEPICLSYLLVLRVIEKQFALRKSFY